MMLLLASLPPASGRAPTDEPRPLAIPAAPRPAVPQPGAPRLGDSRAIRAYRTRYLAVRHTSDIVHGATWGGWAWGYPRWGWPQPWAYRVDSLAVTQGAQRLDVPATFAALGDIPGRQAVERRIRRNRTAATLFTGVGVVGVVTSCAGLVGMDQAVTWDDRRDWSAVALGGAGLVAGGLVGASIPSGRAVRLQHRVEASFDVAELERRVAEHNERLARELGLDPTRALELEQ